MDDELTFSNDPNALLYMLCGFCGKLCDDTFDRRDNALFKLFVEKGYRQEGSLELPEKCEPRTVERLTRIVGAVIKSFDAFIWRQRRQQDLIKEMTAQYNELKKISKRCCTDKFDSNDFLKLRRMFGISSLYMENLDRILSNEQQRDNAEQELRELIDYISSFLEGYKEYDDEAEEEISLDLSSVFCPVCGGSGIKRFCGVCGGSGIDENGGECFDCSGAGWEECPKCHSEGTIQ